MYTKKLTDDEFLEMIIDKELEIAQADIRYKDIMAMPEKEYNDNIYGVYEEKVPDYPYPVPMTISMIGSQRELRKEGRKIISII